MKFIILLLTFGFSNAATAQSPTEVIFKKYSDKNGVSISTDIASSPPDSAGAISQSMTIKTLEVDNEDEEKKIKKLMKQILRDCSKILNQYSAIAVDKDDVQSHKVYKYHSGNMTEIFELEQEQDRLSLTVTRITSNTKETTINFKIQSSNGLIEKTSVENNAKY